MSESLPTTNDKWQTPIDIQEALAKEGGVEKASPELIESIRNKPLRMPHGLEQRHIEFIEQGSDNHHYLDISGAEANSGGKYNTHILSRPNPSKAALLEEFLHGTQNSLGMVTTLNTEYNEFHVKDFMVRHQRLLGLGEEDVARLRMKRDTEIYSEVGNDNYLKALEEKANRRQQYGLVSADLAHSSVSHGMNAAGFVADISNKDYTGATVNAASMAAETRVGSSLLSEGIEKLGLTATFKYLAHAAPIVASVMAYRSMKEEEAKFLAAGRPDLAEAAYQVGKAEITAGVLGGWTAAAGREITRNLYIEVGGIEYTALAHSGEVQVAKGVASLATNIVSSKPVSEVLPTTHGSMAQGTDDMGDRSEIKRIAVERTGLPASDPRNDIQTLLNENKWRPMGHLLILADGTVQGPEQGAIPFGSNPRIAAGKNGETFGVMYAGQGAMNDAQTNAFAQVADHLIQLRTQDGLHSPLEVIAGSTRTAEILNLPTPRGPLQSTEPPQTTPQIQRRQTNSIGGL